MNAYDDMMVSFRVGRIDASVSKSDAARLIVQLLEYGTSGSVRVAGIIMEASKR